jgi:hypothetical protein
MHCSSRFSGHPAAQRMLLRSRNALPGKCKALSSPKQREAAQCTAHHTVTKKEIHDTINIRLSRQTPPSKVTYHIRASPLATEPPELIHRRLAQNSVGRGRRRRRVDPHINPREISEAGTALLEELPYVVGAGALHATLVRFFARLAYYMWRNQGARQHFRPYEVEKGGEDGGGGWARLPRHLAEVGNILWWERRHQIWITVEFIRGPRICSRRSWRDWRGGGGGSSGVVG